MKNLAPKFVLVDSSISGSGGHYLEYAEQVFEAAAHAGFACFLIANRAFKTSPGFVATTFPVLPFDMWGNNLSLRDDHDNRFSEEDRRFLRLHFGRLGLLWAAASNVDAVRLYAREVPLSPSMARNLGRVRELAPTIQRGSEAILAGDTRIPGSHCEERKQRYDALRQAVRQAAEKAVPGQQTELSERVDNLSQNGARVQAYSRAIEEALREIRAGTGDVVFIPTLSFAEATGVRNLLARSTGARRPSWCLLFRRDVYRGYSPEWDSQEWNVHAVRNLFASFVPLAQRTTIKFFCDTDELCRQYERFQSGAFTTAAIPVRTREPGSADAAQRWLDRPQGIEPRIEILFRRNPASEHGVEYLAHVLDALPVHVRDRVRFSGPPSATAVPEHSNEWRAKVTRARLRAYAPHLFRPIAEPHFQPRDWQANMRLFQIVVFVESRATEPSLFHDELEAAASAGKTVVLPGETALSTFFNEVLSKQHPSCRVIRYWEGESSEATAHNISRAIEEAVETLPRETLARVSEEQDSWFLCYLGDARQEKGFALLADLIESNRMTTIAERPLRTIAQVYQTSVQVDIGILKGIERLKQSAQEGNILIDEPLEAAAYNAILARSHFVFNLYDRANYAARSSGVFVEGIAARKPLIVTAGTWMSALMGTYAADYHRDVIAPHSVVSDVLTAGTDPGWKETGLEHGIDIDRDIRPNTTASISQLLGVYCVFRRPDGASHVWIEFELSATYPDICTELSLAWQQTAMEATDPTKANTIREDRAVLNRMHSGSQSVVFEIPQSCEDLRLSFRIAYGSAAAEIDWLRLRWVNFAGAAFQPGGISVAEAPPAEMVGRASSAAATVLSNYGAYVDSCEWLGKHWGAAQTADELLRQLLDAPALEYRARLAGHDW